MFWYRDKYYILRWEERIGKACNVSFLFITFTGQCFAQKKGYIIIIFETQCSVKSIWICVEINSTRKEIKKTAIMATETAQYLLKLLSLTSCTVSSDVRLHGANTKELWWEVGHIFLIRESQTLPRLDLFKIENSRERGERLFRCEENLEFLVLNCCGDRQYRFLFLFSQKL